MASTQRAYRNPDEYESEKSASPFTRISQVRASTLAERHRNLIVAMLHKNRFGDELWMSTESICVVMGRVCYRRKQSGWSAHERPRRLSDCEQISRRAVQRLIDEVCDLGVLSLVFDANRDVPYGGGKKFRHTATYRLNPEKLVPRKTHDQYVEERDRARARSRQLHREESERERAHEVQAAEVTPIRKTPQPAEAPKPPEPAAPLPDKKVAESSDARKLTSRQGPKLVNEMRRLMRGYQGSQQGREGGIWIGPDHPQYREPMTRENALIEACMNLAIPLESASEFLKLLPRDVGESEKEQGL